MISARAIVEFLDVPAAASWSMTPEEAVAFLKAKGLAESFDYRDLIGKEHARAFTVAKMMDADLLADVKESLDHALATGVPFREWADNITPMLQAKGWWGRKQVTDPLTGETVVAGLGSPSRLQTIYRTNMQSAYAAGAWDAIEANKDLAPFLLYDAVDDHRTRPEHAAWDGTVLEVDDPWWSTHYPPNGWNCRCSVIQLSEEDLTDLGMAPGVAPKDGTVAWTNPRTGRTRQVPKGVDPGWDYNVGAERAKALAKTVAEKLKGYPPGFDKAAAAGLAKAKDAGEALAKQVAAGQLDLAKAMGSEAMTRASMKAATRSAQWQLDEALKSKTPYLAKSITELQKTKAGAAMGPAELLAAAKVQAEKLHHGAQLSEWKKAYLAGKTPSAKAQAAFLSLPDDAAQALVAQLDQVAATKAAEAAAQTQLDAIVLGSSKTLEGKALEKIMAAAGAGGTLPNPVALLAQVQADVAAAKAVQVAGQLQAGLKKALIAEKIPTPAQIAHLKGMDAPQLDAFLKEVEAAKAAAKVDAPPPVVPAASPPGAAPVTTPSALNPDKLVQIGPQKGSNPGGLYRDTDTGEQWYIKTPPSAEHARNEVLAGQLYRLAGVDTPELRLTVLNGQPAVASRIVDGLTKVDADSFSLVDGAFEGFAVDAWLANWDVVGATFDNLLVKGWSAFRVDTGGALRFRAQGGLKGSAWGNSVTELDSLRQAATNPQAAAVFGSMTSEQLAASAAKLLKIDRDAMDALVDQFGPGDLVERQALKATLRARLDDIAKRLGIAPAPVRAPPAPILRQGGKTITATDLDRITESRANGYTVSTDGGDVEDHQVLLQHYTGADGVKRTRLVAKLRGEGAMRAEGKLADKVGEVAGPDMADLREKTLALAKSINSRHAKGGSWDDTVGTRLSDYKRARLAALEKLEPLEVEGNPEALAILANIKRAHQAVVEWQQANGINDRIVQALAKIDIASLRDLVVAPKAVAGEAVTWTKARAFYYNLARFDRSHMIETGDSESLPGVNRVLEGRGEGVRVRFVPDDPQANSVSSRGLVHVDVDGADLAAAERAMDTLAELGVTTTRTTQGERLGLYLDKLGNLRGLKDTTLRTAWAKLDKLPDETARNAAKLALLNKEVGYDLTKSPHWNPDGVYQAFGHGRTLQLRPDLDTPEMAKLEERAVVYTNVTGLGVGAGTDQWERLLSAIDGGGILSSQVERARRGIRSTGSSVHADHQSGGASYVFTRLLPATTKSAGVYFKPRILRRIDAFSYDGDRFGSVDVNVQRQHRAIDAAGFLRNMGNHGNETNFRDGISLFDDLERIVFRTQAEAKRAIADMKARGYTTWPDGRALTEVLLGP